jgi:hypothetical protein
MILALTVLRPAFSQCTKDFDCKGDRICVNGTCVEAHSDSITTTTEKSRLRLNKKNVMPNQIGSKQPIQQTPIQQQPVEQKPIQQQPAQQKPDQQHEASSPQPKKVIVMTTIGGDVSKVSFKKEKGPFIVIEDLVIPEGTTVTMEKGCVLLFKEFTTLNVYGNVMVKGSEGEPVVFTSVHDSAYNHKISEQANPFDWNGVRLQKSSKGSSFEYMHLDYSTFGLYSTNTDLIVKTCEFKKNGQNNVMIEGKMQVVVEGMPYSYTNAVTPDTDRKIIPDPAHRNVSLFTVGIYGCIQDFVNFLNADQASSLQGFANSFYSNPHFYVQPKALDLGFGAQVFYRINKDISLTASVEYVPAYACSTYVSGFLDAANSEWYSWSQASQYSFFTFGAGAFYNLLDKGKNVLRAAVAGKLGNVHYKVSETEFEFYNLTDTKLDPDNCYAWLREVNATLNGLTFGMNIGLNYQYRITSKFSFCAALLFDCLLSSSIEGDGYTSLATSKIENGAIVKDSTSNAGHKFAIMKRPLRGGGTFFDLIQDPDMPGTTAWQSYREFTNIRLNLGVAYSF